MRAPYAALLLVASPALAEERITQFDSRIAVQRDGSVEVVENISVTVENHAINHGIYRDFPTRYAAKSGKIVRVRFTLLGTELDGTPEPGASESLSNGVRIRIGSAEKTVPTGDHRYTIRYRATRELGHFPHYDELYWNVTGNGWDFPIDHATASVTLPSPVKFGQRAAYTGPQGSTASNARVIVDEPGLIRFETTAPLAPREGLTVAAAFPKGVVEEPGTSSRFGWFLADWGPILAALSVIAGLIGYLIQAWRKVGRDPPKGTVVPIFVPPDNLSPAAMRFLTKQQVDNRGFAAALVEAAVAGHVRLREDDGGFFSSTKKYIDRLSGGKPVDPATQSALAELTIAGDSIEMDNSNHQRFSAAQKRLTENFEERFVGKLFKRNYGWAAVAVMVALAGLWLTALMALLADGTMPGLAVFSIIALAAAGVLYGLTPPAKGAMRIFVQILTWGAVALAAMTGLPLIFQALEAGRWQPMAIAALGLPIALSAFWWIDAPTKEGRVVLDRIAGFKQYLSITERDRLDRMQAPADSLQLFERYLPYAIALGVENRWADRFASTLAAASAAQAQGSAFGWYSGSHSPWSDTGGFVESIGSSLSSSVSSASTAPGGSSGSGGGGSSGGGGGGGGGGGW